MDSLDLGRIIDWFLGFFSYELFRIDNQPFSVSRLFLGVALLVVSYMVASRLASAFEHRFLKRLEIEDSLKYTLSRFSFYILLVIAVLFTLRVLNIPITIFTVLGGALAIGIGFGSQNLVNNFLSGLIVMVERPVRVGDFVEMDGLTGYVERIGMRSTVLTTFNNTRVVIPNRNLVEDRIVNWTLGDDFQRTIVSVGVAYGSNTELVEKLLIQAAQDDEDVMKDREILVLFMDFGNSSLDFQLVFWTRVRNQRERFLIQSRIRFEIDHLFREHGVQIPFPQRDIHLDFDGSRPFPVSIQKQ